MNNETQINKFLDGNAVADYNPGVTHVNTSITDSNIKGTVINDSLNNSVFVRPGMILCGEYTVINRLDTATGEADLYLCENNNIKYVAKVYRRKVAIKPEITNKLISLNSLNVARIYSTGEINGFPVEVIPYYKNGSLEERKYTYIELKKHIIPSINQGLKVLHDNRIIHKDLKPSNIMLTDNSMDVAIIDFGISSVRESGNTVVVTKTGMTPEYSAPETFRNLFLTESDYYSFGITIYKLFCGYTPYEKMSDDEIEKYVSVQKIPFPSDMPEDLKDLISALTYYDITNRKEIDNPNRRWGYNEVEKWCKGEKQLIPGEGNTNTIFVENTYKFLGKEYSDISKLVYSLGCNWEDGKKQLFRGLLSSYFKQFNSELAGYCIDAEEAAQKGADNDILFLKTLYNLDSKTTTFYWKGEVFENLSVLGNDILGKLWNNDGTVKAFIDSILQSGALSVYSEAMKTNDKSIINTLNGLESSYRAVCKTNQEKEKQYFLTAYILSEKKVLRYNAVDFRNINEVVVYMDGLLHSSYENFERFCKVLLDEQGLLNPQFEAWLIVLGKQNEIINWRNELK